MIHRDVKPQNLVLLPDGTVKVVDFGLAAETAASWRPSASARRTTWRRRSASRSRAEPASDVYSLGITLYHLLVGQPPHSGLSIKEILRRTSRGSPSTPSGSCPASPKKVCDLVRVDDEARPASCGRRPRR